MFFNDFQVPSNVLMAVSHQILVAVTKTNPEQIPSAVAILKAIQSNPHKYPAVIPRAIINEVRTAISDPISSGCLVRSIVKLGRANYQLFQPISQYRELAFACLRRKVETVSRLITENNLNPNLCVIEPLPEAVPNLPLTRMHQTLLKRASLISLVSMLPHRLEILDLLIQHGANADLTIRFSEATAFPPMVMAACSPFISTIGRIKVIQKWLLINPNPAFTLRSLTEGGIFASYCQDPETAHYLISWVARKCDRSLTTQVISELFNNLTEAFGNAPLRAGAPELRSIHFVTTVITYHIDLNPSSFEQKTSTNSYHTELINAFQGALAVKQAVEKEVTSDKEKRGLILSQCFAAIPLGVSLIDIVNNYASAAIADACFARTYQKTVPDIEIIQ